MIRAILSDAAELTGLGLFLAALAMILAPCDAQALTPEAADAGAYALSAVAIFILFIAWAIWRVAHAIGRDVAAHDANMHVAERAESITGEG
jgi:hypothetical protein